MMTIQMALKMSCGCTEALIEDDDLGSLVVTTANACKGMGWWCECVDPREPEVCEHAVMLLDWMGAV
jgi:hypothetical protein